jgi:hypothetical protein
MKRSALVGLNNASIHIRGEVEVQIKQWEGLSLLYLPSYITKRTLIEILYLVLESDILQLIP